MTIAKTALCAAALAGLPTIAQDSAPDCNSPSAVLFQTCTTEPAPEVSEEASNELSERAAVPYGRTFQFQRTDDSDDISWGDSLSFEEVGSNPAVSYTHLTLPTRDDV